MAFFVTTSPHTHQRRNLAQIMMLVALATLPGIVALGYCFSWAILVQIGLAVSTAITTEACILALRRRPIFAALSDNSALVTGLLIGIAIPPFAPWWIAVIGAVVAIVIAKQLYGGLGQNPFNPAMIAYVVLLISFPVPMTTWLAPVNLHPEPLSIFDGISAIFSGVTLDGFSVEQLRLSVDGTTMATPLDTIKSGLRAGSAMPEILSQPIFSTFAAYGWSWVNLGFLLGGALLLKLRVIQWHIPTAMLSTLLLCSLIGYGVSPETHPSPVIALFSGATMLGAFFIATDPVSAATTPRGRLIFGALIGVLVYLIRTQGGFPDGVAFAVLIANMCVPLIDYYTQPKTFGATKAKS